MSAMSRTAALRQAISESSMHRQGSGWIVSTYDPIVDRNRESHERPYFAARERLCRWRSMRAAALAGLDELSIYDATGSARERLAAATEAAK